MANRQRWLVVVAVVALLALIVGVAGLAVVRGDSDEPSGAFEVRAIFRSRTTDAFGNVKDGTSQLLWSYNPPSKWRHETTASGASGTSKITVSDGRYLWQYYPPQSAYCKVPAEYKGTVVTIPDGMPPAFIGPSSEPSLERFLEQLRSIDPSITVVDAGNDEYLSRVVRVVEYSPAAPAGSGWQPSFGRIWIDSEEMFVLRHRIEETGGQHRFYDSSVVEFAPGEAQVDSFHFEPPAGAQEFLPIGGNCDQGLTSGQAD